MPTIHLGMLKQGIEPAALAGAAITVESTGSPFYLITVQGSSQVITREVLTQLEARQVVDWLGDQHRQVALGVPPTVTFPGGGGIPADYDSPMLDPANPPQYTDAPDSSARHQTLWRIGTYAAAVVVIPIIIFFVYAMLSKSVMTLGDAFRSFGAMGFVLSVAAGIGVGYAVDTLARKSA